MVGRYLDEKMLQGKKREETKRKKQSVCEWPNISIPRKLFSEGLTFEEIEMYTFSGNGSSVTIT